MQIIDSFQETLEKLRADIYRYFENLVKSYGKDNLLVLERGYPCYYMNYEGNAIEFLTDALAIDDDGYCILKDGDKSHFLSEVDTDNLLYLLESIRFNESFTNEKGE